MLVRVAQEVMLNIKNHFAYLTAYLYTRQAGLSLEESDDCSTQFLEEETKKAGGLENLNRLCRDSPALIRKCALDFVRNNGRAAHRLASHQTSWPQTVNASGKMLEWEANANQAEPDTEMVRQAFWDILLPFLETLSLNQCEYLIRHHLRGEEVADIARSAGRSTHAIEQSLYRSRTKLRAELEKAHLSYSDLRQFLTSPPPAISAPSSFE